MKFLHNSWAKIFFKLPHVAITLVILGQISVLAQPSKEGTFDWTLPFQSCRNLIINDTNITAVASDNDGNLYTMSSSSVLNAIDIFQPVVIWNVDFGSTFVSNLAQSEKELFIVSKIESNKDDGILWAVSKLTGITNWRSEIPFANKIVLRMANLHIIGLSDSFAFALDRQTGSPKWRINNELNFLWLKDDPADVDKDFIARMLQRNLAIIQRAGNLREEITEISSAQESLLVGDRSGTFQSYDKSTGNRIWSTKTGGKITSINLLDNNSVLVTSLDNFLYLFSIKNGNLKWKRRLPFRLNDKPFIVDQIAVVGNKGSDQVFFIELDSGRIINHISLPESEYLTANPLILQEKLIVPTTQGVFSYSQNPCVN